MIRNRWAWWRAAMLLGGMLSADGTAASAATSPCQGFIATLTAAYVEPASEAIVKAVPQPPQGWRLTRSPNTRMTEEQCAWPLARPMPLVLAFDWAADLPADQMARRAAAIQAAMRPSWPELDRRAQVFARLRLIPQELAEVSPQVVAGEASAASMATATKADRMMEDEQGRAERAEMKALGERVMEAHQRGDMATVMTLSMQMAGKAQSGRTGEMMKVLTEEGQKAGEERKRKEARRAQLEAERTRLQDEHVALAHAHDKRIAGIKDGLQPRDSEVAIVVSINRADYALPEEAQPLTVPGTVSAFRLSDDGLPQASGRWQEGRTVLFLGPWSRTDTAMRPSMDPKAGNRSPQTIVVEIAADRRRAEDIVKTMDLAALGRLIAP